MSEGPAEQPTFDAAEVRESTSPWLGWLAREATRLWWLAAAACLLAALLLTLASVRSQGPDIIIRFRQGHGIKPGDTLRHRGIDVGQVSSVHLDDRAERVLVRVELNRDARDLAREGSRFWIERPQISLSRVSGLDTVIGAKYLAVEPGPAEGGRQREFDGLETPPAVTVGAADQERPQEITVRFREGHGLASGDAVKYRSIVVGEVTSVDLTDDLQGIEARIRLVHRAGRLARSGTQFWIEHPQVSVTRVRGLETLVGGRYVSVLPGTADAERLNQFDGLDHPPAAAERPPGGLEVVLESPHRFGLDHGVPITYRGVPIGHVVSLGLTSDAGAFEARAYILPDFRPLVRTNTRFWSTGGIDLRVGLTGVELDAESLSTIVTGGVALATPDTPGEAVTTGHRFALVNEPEEEWLKWRPRIALGVAGLPAGIRRVQPMRAVLRWRGRKLGMSRSYERSGWAVAIGRGQQLILPAELLTVKEGSPEAVLEVEGRQFAFAADRAHHFGPLGGFSTTNALDPSRVWPVDRIRAADQPEDCLLICGPDMSIPVSTGRLEPGDGVWQLERSLSLDDDWHGAGVQAVGDGKLIGLLLVVKGRGRIGLFSEAVIEWLRRGN